MTRSKTFLLAVLMALTGAALAPSSAWAAAGDWAVNEQSRVRLITPYQAAPRDGDIRLGLHFKLSPGWHVYWKNSGDAGFPPVVVFEKAVGLGETELLWPAPERFELPGDLVAFGYEDEVVYPVRARLAQDALTDSPGNSLKLAADVDYLVCEVDCIPYRYTVTLDQPLAPAGAPGVPDPETEPLVTTWWNRLPAAAESLEGVTTTGSLQVSGQAAGAGEAVLEIRVDGVRAGSEPPGLFLESHEAFDTGKPEARTTEGGVVFRVPLQAKEAGRGLPAETELAWTVTNLEHGLEQGGRPVNVEARRTVARGAATAASGSPESGEESSSPLSPILAALAAVGSALLALWLWGLLGPQSQADDGVERPGREALGFAAVAAVLGMLYALSRQISFEGLAWIQLALLAMSLCAWLRHRSGRRSLRLAWGVGLLAFALAAPWLAERNRLTPLGGLPAASAPAEPAG
jgi:DsbC/DsbD-like thiol-disulfide interchange protein